MTNYKQKKEREMHPEEVKSRKGRVEKMEEEEWKKRE